MINQQEGTKAGVSKNDLGAPFSLSALCEELAYSLPPLAGATLVIVYFENCSSKNFKVKFPLDKCSSDISDISS